MKTLLLLRHAKSDWSDPNRSDHERVLNKRGRRSAPAIGDWIRQHKLAPDQILSSDAARTIETWERTGLEGEPEFHRTLYLAEAGTMINALSGANGERVMMVGHNPGIGSLAERLAKSPPDNPRFFQYPTASLSVLEFPIERWPDVEWNTGTLRAFVTPHQFGIGKE
jgi:phosphohistidine phosphatase